MAWRRPGDKPLSGPMMVRLPTHICVTRPQWVKPLHAGLVWRELLYFQLIWSFNIDISVYVLERNDLHRNQSPWSVDYLTILAPLHALSQIVAPIVPRNITTSIKKKNYVHNTHSEYRTDAYILILTGNAKRLLSNKGMNETCFRDNLTCFHRSGEAAAIDTYLVVYEK